MIERDVDPIARREVYKTISIGFSRHNHVDQHNAVEGPLAIYAAGSCTERLGSCKARRYRLRCPSDGQKLFYYSRTLATAAGKKGKPRMDRRSSSSTYRDQVSC